jgi:hypothetical protein
MLLDLLCYKWHSISQILVIPHRFKKIGLHKLVVRRIFSDILLVLGLKMVEKHCSRTNSKRWLKWLKREFVSTIYGSRPSKDKISGGANKCGKYVTEYKENYLWFTTLQRVVRLGLEKNIFLRVKLLVKAR